MQNVIEVKNLTKNYKNLRAIDDLSFEVKEGEILGLLGPNGSGKSTTIKMLSGILTPDNGEILVDKMIPYKDREKYVRNIGVVFGQRSQLWWDIPAEDTFDLIREIYKLDKEEYENISEDIYDEVYEKFIDMLFETE